MNFNIASSKKWEKTHIQLIGVWGASVCRYANVQQNADEIRPIKKDELPTCSVCKRLLERWRKGGLSG